MLAALQGPRGVAVPAFHLSLPVADLDATVDFYADVLGCRRGRRGSDWADLDFFGHQLSLHLVAGYTPDERTSEVDATRVPLRHHGVVLDPAAWQALADRLRAADVSFLLSPRSRFVGQDGEQHTFFVRDPSGNAIEVKAFPDGVWR
jgi:extradiol dioxygenase family protein